MIIGVSGHRYVMYEPILYKMVHEKFLSMMIELKPEKVITGMALGFDTIVAEVCVELNIPFIAAVPFVGQENKWTLAAVLGARRARHAVRVRRNAVLAEIGIRTPRVPHVVFVVDPSQENSQKEKYKTLLSKAAEIKIVSEGPFSKQKFQIRNQWIVDNSDSMIVYFTGQPGGTKNCIDYAKSVNKSIRYIFI